MNKTLSIGLAGFSFMIEEHAYIKLSDYLAALRNSLDANEADEVMHDIEIRMVEIFRDSLGKREVINNEDVEKVIAQLGTPEAIEEQEEAYYSETSTKQKRAIPNAGNFSGNKQLFRDPENAKLGGVCSGLAHYTGMDVSWMRVIWIVLAITGLFTAAISTTLVILIYIILWAVLPVAQSTSDFLKMKGKPVNFDTIKEESNKIVQFANESTQKVGQMYNESKPMINSAGNSAWNVIRYILGIMFAFFGFIFLIGSFAVFGFIGNNDFPPISFMNYLFDDGNMKYTLMAICVLSCLIPSVLFTVLSIKLLSPKTKIRNIGWVIGALIIALIALSTIFGINMAKQDMLLKGSKEDTEEVAIPTDSDSIFVDVKQITIPQNFTGFDDDIYSDKKTVYEKDYLYVDVTRKANIKSPYLIIKKEAKGYNIPLNISVPVEIVGNKISLPNYVKFPYQHRFRDYEINYELVIPQNMIVVSLKDNAIDFNGDLNNNGINDDDEDDNDDKDNQSGQNKITINGNTIEFDAQDKDSIIIKGKKYPKSEIGNIGDTIKKEILKNKNVDIKIKEGKDEISIKTNK